MGELDRKLEDIAEIRAIMERSAKFLSLSGLSGVSAGCAALAGAIVAQVYLNGKGGYVADDPAVQQFLTIDALIVLVIALLLALLFTRRMAKRKGLPVWNKTAQYLLTSLLIPIGTGAAVCVILAVQGLFVYAVPSTLIFYGLGLTDASKYTLHEVRYLGLADIVLGLVGAIIPMQALWLWAAGFGVLHIVYGIVMYRTYER